MIPSFLVPALHVDMYIEQWQDIKPLLEIENVIF